MAKKGSSKHRPLKVLKHFAARKERELKRLAALIKKRGG